MENSISALAFGPEERIPNAERLKQLSHILRGNSRFTALSACLKHLPDVWTAVVHEDDRLESVAGEKRASALSRLLLDDQEHEDDMHANQVIMPMTVLIHMVQYRQFLQQYPTQSHASILRSVAAGGVQGFCAGLISAFAVCSMNTEDDFDACATFAIKLSMCVGAYVDYSMSETNLETSSAILRWSIANGRNQVNEVVAQHKSVCYPFIHLLIRPS